ncbi:MAG TPA: PaaI family thioesterase [Pseudacidobacterium sp.]|jgi:uncharacterized protein (TIGR00369 family)|nr:PaaI family thioesterase [Pseudacidobacterium sp.]
MSTKGLTPLAHGALNRCFGCGTENKTGLRLKFFIDEQQQIVCRIRLAQRFEGPPGHAHGGIIATLLDEAMSKANRLHGVTAMTRQMDVEYLRPVRLNHFYTLTGRRLSQDGRKNLCEAAITDSTGTVLARSKALFIAVDRTKLAQFAVKR